MRIIEELLKIKSIEDNEKYFSALESIILKLRYERKYFNISYDSSYFEGINQHSQFSYIIPTWCFLYYQNKQFHSVIGLIESFLSYEFGFLNEIDVQRTSSGAMHCK